MISNYEKLKIINETILEAMAKIIELEGRSDLTLDLEGSYYEIRDMLSEHKKENKDNISK